MINPNENDLTRDEPLPTQQQFQSAAEEIGSTGREQFRRATNKFSTAMSQTWDGTKEKAGRARERTEYLVRENPMPAILTALREAAGPDVPIVGMNYYSPLLVQWFSDPASLPVRVAALVTFNDLLVTYGQNLCKPISPFCSRCKIAQHCKRVGVTVSR